MYCKSTAVLLFYHFDIRPSTRIRILLKPHVFFLFFTIERGWMNVWIYWFRVESRPVLSEIWGYFKKYADCVDWALFVVKQTTISKYIFLIALFIRGLFQTGTKLDLHWVSCNHWVTTEAYASGDHNIGQTVRYCERLVINRTSKIQKKYLGHLRGCYLHFFLNIPVQLLYPLKINRDPVAS